MERRHFMRMGAATAVLAAGAATAGNPASGVPAMPDLPKPADERAYMAGLLQKIAAPGALQQLAAVRGDQ